MKWTQQGVSTVKDVPMRNERAKDIYKSIGVEVKALYFTFGK
jgi:uncharacterized protein with GYD domain